MCKIWCSNVINVMQRPFKCMNWYYMELYLLHFMIYNDGMVHAWRPVNIGPNLQFKVCHQDPK